MTQPTGDANRTKPTDLSARSTIGMTPEGRTLLKVWCIRHDVTMGDFIRHAIDAELRRAGANFQVSE